MIPPSFAQRARALIENNGNNLQKPIHVRYQFKKIRGGYQGKNQVIRHTKQGSDVNSTEIARPKVINIDYNIVSTLYLYIYIYVYESIYQI